ncbi:MAG: class I SAM-dependent methyltransferase [Rhodospirillum sp.]|nr:class I SAM-dependent methyltransferase [Rhodospirillum sp.]MCF8489099.1 class I SAM-dependent methyltransferase [Rhodospirillum sp.]MCF8498889.1 class I SAM-dependent methyltransferase [Rhodospirillum sp.]
MTLTAHTCRICGSTQVKLVKASNVGDRIQNSDFQITDYRYGTTLAIYQCLDCTFLQCLDLEDSTAFYAELVDPDYEAGRGERTLQSNKLLDTMFHATGAPRPGARLLDVGAGSGILVEAAANLGLAAEGIEPSSWLQERAVAHGCHVHAGVLPHPDVAGPFDYVTIVDVIEHVDDPRGLLRVVKSLIKSNGVVAVVTPDVASMCARVMGWRWWHFRIAHVGYFSKKTLQLACRQEGFKVISISRPGWVFTLSYLLERLGNYLPKWLLPKPADWMSRTNVPLNLGDSLMMLLQVDDDF